MDVPELTAGLLKGGFAHSASLTLLRAVPILPAGVVPLWPASTSSSRTHFSAKLALTTHQSGVTACLPNITLDLKCAINSLKTDILHMFHNSRQLINKDVLLDQQQQYIRLSYSRVQGRAWQTR